MWVCVTRLFLSISHMLVSITSVYINLFIVHLYISTFLYICLYLSIYLSTVHVEPSILLISHLSIWNYQSYLYYIIHIYGFISIKYLFYIKLYISISRIYSYLSIYLTSLYIYLTCVHIYLICLHHMSIISTTHHSYLSISYLFLHLFITIYLSYIC